MARIELGNELEAAAWEKDQTAYNPAEVNSPRRHYAWILFIMAVVLLYIVVNSNINSGQYFITVRELQSDPAYIGEAAQIVGAVLGPSIEYDVERLRLRFTVAHMPTRTEDLSRALFEAANDESRPRLTIQLDGEVMPSQLQDHAQAIVSGSLAADGIFYANQLQFKCPTRFGDLPEHQELAPLS